MTPHQQRAIYRELIGWFQCACVPLQAVVSSVNSAIENSPYDAVSDEARSFVQFLLQKDRVLVGSLLEGDEWILSPWQGDKSEHTSRVLAALPLGETMEEEMTIWFDLQKKSKATIIPFEPYKP